MTTTQAPQSHSLDQYLEAYRADRDAKAQALEAEQQARIDRALGLYEVYVSAWLGDILPVLAPGDVKVESRGHDVELSQPATLDGHPGHIYLKVYSDGSGRPHLVVGDQKLDPTVKESFPGRRVITLEPADPAAFGNFIERVRKWAANAAWRKESDGITHACRWVGEAPTIDDVKARLQEAIERFSDKADVVQQLHYWANNRIGTIQDRDDMERGRQQAEADRAADVAAAEAARIAAWYPFAIYSVRFCSSERDEDGEFHTGSEYVLAPQPDAAGWWQKVTHGKVVPCRVLFPLTVERIEIPHRDSVAARYVCDATFKADVRIVAPPLGAERLAEQAGPAA